MLSHLVHVLPTTALALIPALVFSRDHGFRRGPERAAELERAEGRLMARVHYHAERLAEEDLEDREYHRGRRVRLMRTLYAVRRAMGSS